MTSASGGKTDTDVVLLSIFGTNPPPGEPSAVLIVAPPFPFAIFFFSFSCKLLCLRTLGPVSCMSRGHPCTPGPLHLSGCYSRYSHNA